MAFPGVHAVSAARHCTVMHRYRRGWRGLAGMRCLHRATVQNERKRDGQDQ
jgi:hypothetical protein